MSCYRSNCVTFNLSEISMDNIKINVFVFLLLRFRCVFKKILEETYQKRCYNEDKVQKTKSSEFRFSCFTIF